jgi:hypothetical protein
VDIGHGPNRAVGLKLDKSIDGKNDVVVYAVADAPVFTRSLDGLDEVIGASLPGFGEREASACRPVPGSEPAPPQPNERCGTHDQSEAHRRLRYQ